VKHTFFILKLIVPICYLFILSGCSLFGGSDESIIELSISASEQLNPDIESRPSPIVLRIYQLTHIDTFNNSDFFALYENDQTLLAQDLKYREELEIQPKHSKIKRLEISPDSKFIAVLAAFRDLDKAQWKSFVEIDPLNLQPLKIDLGESTVIIDFINKASVFPYSSLSRN